MILVIAAVGMLPALTGASSARAGEAGEAHHGDCAAMTGIQRARCERHERMFEKCHAIRGEAHHQCDREYIVANPLDCGALAGNDGLACERERKAVRACTGTQGSDFFRCVQKLLRSDPRH